MNVILRRKKFILFPLLLLCIFYESCSESERYERKLKRDVMHYLDKHLKDPSSLKDLEIDYAILPEEEQRPFFENQLVDYKNGNSTVYPISPSSETVVVVIKYRAKNSFGAYIQDFEALEYNPSFSSDLMRIRPLNDSQSYCLKAMLKSPNRKKIR